MILGLDIGTGAGFLCPPYSCIAVFRNVYIFVNKPYEIATYKCILCGNC